MYNYKYIIYEYTFFVCAYLCMILSWCSPHPDLPTKNKSKFTDDRYSLYHYSAITWHLGRMIWNQRKAVNWLLLFSSDSIMQVMTIVNCDRCHWWIRIRVSLGEGPSEGLLLSTSMLFDSQMIIRQNFPEVL